VGHSKHVRDISECVSGVHARHIAYGKLISVRVERTGTTAEYTCAYARVCVCVCVFIEEIRDNNRLSWVRSGRDVSRSRFNGLSTFSSPRLPQTR